VINTVVRDLSLVKPSTLEELANLSLNDSRSQFLAHFELQSHPVSIFAELLHAFDIRLIRWLLHVENFFI